MFHVHWEILNFYKKKKAQEKQKELHKPATPPRTLAGIIQLDFSQICQLITTHVSQINKSK